MSVNHQKLTNFLFTVPELTILAEANDVQSILAYLNDKNRQRTNEKIWKSKDLLDKFDVQLGAGMLYGLEQAAKQDTPMGAILRSTAATLNSDGLNFSNSKVQFQIDELVKAGVWTKDVGNTLKSLGIYYESLADQEFGGDITEQDVIDAMVLYDRRKLQIRVTERYNAVVQVVEAGDVKDWDAARVAMGAE